MARSTTKSAPKAATKAAARKGTKAAPKAASTKAAKAAPKAAVESREAKAAKVANAALLGGPRPVAEGQALSAREVEGYAVQLGAKAATKAAVLKACGLTLPQLKAFAEGREEGRGLSGLGKGREAFEAFYRGVKAANPSPRVRPRKVAAALLGLHSTAAK